MGVGYDPPGGGGLMPGDGSSFKTIPQTDASRAMSKSHKTAPYSSDAFPRNIGIVSDSNHIMPPV